MGSLCVSGLVSMQHARTCAEQISELMSCERCTSCTVSLWGLKLAPAQKRLSGHSLKYYFPSVSKSKCNKMELWDSKLGLKDFEIISSCVSGDRILISSLKTFLMTRFITRAGGKFCDLPNGRIIFNV